jgi:hypothetical protein
MLKSINGPISKKEAERKEAQNSKRVKKPPQYLQEKKELEELKKTDKRKLIYFIESNGQQVKIAWALMDENSEG